LNRKPLECKSWNLNINGTLSKLILPILSLNLIPMTYLKKKKPSTSWKISKGVTKTESWNNW